MSGDDFILGGGVAIDGTFKNADEEPVDPTNLTLMVEKPDGTEVAIDPLTFDHIATGHYRAFYAPDVAGRFNYLWSGTGLRPVAVDGEFYVREPVTSTPEGWQPPSAGQVWETSRLDFEALGYTTTSLQPLIDSAVAWVSWVTGRPMDATLPDALEPLARDAIRMRVEQQTQRTSADAIQVTGQEGIASVGVSGLSISFRDPNSGSASKSSIGPVPTSWMALNEVLWPLMTEDRYEYWYALSTGTFPPDYRVQEVDWAAGGWGWGAVGGGWGW